MSAARRRLRWVRAVLVLLGAVVTLAVAAVPAVAHNSLMATSPTDRQRVPRPPAVVVLTFNEPAVALGTEVLITGPSGPVHQGAPALVDNTVTQGVQPGAPAGPYTVAWRVTSADGHPISGSFTFTAASPGSGAPVTAEPVPAPATPQPPGSSVVAWFVGLAVAVTVGGVILARRSRKRG